MHGVVRRPVVRSARCGQPDRELRLVPIAARYAWRDRVLDMVQLKARCAGVVPCGRGRRMRVASRTLATGAPNTPMQPTASRARSLVF